MEEIPRMPRKKNRVRNRISFERNAQAGQSADNSDRPADAERIRRRQKAVRRRLLRRSVLWGIGAIGATALAFTTTLGQAVANKFIDPHASTSAAPRTSPPADLKIGRGYKVAVDFQYPPGQSFALPQALTDGSRAAQLRAGFADPVEGMKQFLRENSGSARKDLQARLVFTGISSQKVHILSLEVVMMKVEQNLQGTAIKTSSGSSDATLPVRIDMDTPGRSFSQDGIDFFANHEINVSAADWETVDAHFVASKNSYRWLIAIHSVDLSGKRITSYLDSAGNIYDKPSSAPALEWFALSGIAHTYHVTYTDDYNTGGRGFHVATP
jgi:hypothetical protein